MSNTIKCPHPTCPYTFPKHKGFQQQLRLHLSTVHSFTENKTIKNHSSLNKLHCYLCQQCHTIFASSSKLQQHCRHYHPTQRQQTNTDIVFQTYSYDHTNPTIYQQTRQQWEHSFQWLTKLDIQPPTKRKSIYPKLKGPAKQLSLAILHHIVTWCNNALMQPDQTLAKHPTWETTATPFLKILFMFESLFLAPPTEPGQSYHTLLQQRHALLKHGKLQKLYDITRQTNTTNRTPTTPNFNDLTYNRLAQEAADSDNLHTAYNRIKSVTPTVTLTPHYQTLLKKLYPSRIQSHATQPVTRHSHSSDHPNIDFITPQNVLKTFQKQKRGTAPGPFADSIDLFRDYATYTTNKTTNQQPYLEPFTKLLNHIASNNLPTAAQSAFGAQYVIALHKDPNNLDKIRPIGIGTALRRITAATLMTIYGHTFASILVPDGQMGIAIPGGLDFICHSTQAQLTQYMSSPQLSSRVLLTLDIANMFNAVSRDACRHQLNTHPQLATLRPFFDLLYRNNNRCWHKTPDGYDSFPQEEGFTQGCPLSGAFADLVLALVLKPINQQLKQRMISRQDYSITPTTLSYHDDTSIVLPYQDITWFIETFQQLGQPLGIRLNISKTQLLTSLTDESPLQYLQPDDQTALQEALAFLGQSTEYHNGIKLLGQPIGSQQFANDFLTDQITHLQTTLVPQLTHRITDSQTQMLLLKHCMIPSVFHLLANHVYHTYQSNSTDTDLYGWNSEATLALRIIIHDVVAQITTQMSLPAHCIPILHLPVTLGGIGIRDPIATALPTYYISTARTIRYAQFGIQLGPQNFKLTDIHQNAIQHTHHQTILQQYGTTFLPALPEQRATNDLTHFIQHTSLHGLNKHFYHHHQKQIHKNLLENPPPNLSAAMPSLLSPLTSIPLTSLPRKIETNRLSNPEFRLLLQRKLRIPILSEIIHCTCRHKPKIDPYGDHLFSCSAMSKTALHNQTRDTIYNILTLIAPLAGITQTKNEIVLEPPSILPTYPTLRPADVGLHLTPKPSYNGNETPNQFIAIDISFSSTPVQADSDIIEPPAQNKLQQVHDIRARQKLNNTHAHLLESQGVILLPFTIDHLGGIGYFATDFLFGTQKNTIVPPASTKPNWNRITFKNNPSAYDIYSKIKNIPTKIFDTATKNWERGLPAKNHTGTNHFARTPTQWATQTLALNLTKALARHITTHLQTIQLAKHNNRKCQTNAHKNTPYILPPPPFLSPSTNDTEQIQYKQASNQSYEAPTHLAYHGT